MAAQSVSYWLFAPTGVLPAVGLDVPLVVFDESLTGLDVSPVGLLLSRVLAGPAGDLPPLPDDRESVL
ncbi:MAG: hypothetical protein LBJ62_00620 [Bifidobacteriaceae bacterium]|nr:hypothetical protein [Bifidobacteriaceae bacterium]